MILCRLARGLGPIERDGVNFVSTLIIHNTSIYKCQGVLVACAPNYYLFSYHLVYTR